MITCPVLIVFNNSTCVLPPPSFQPPAAPLLLPNTETPKIPTIYNTYTQTSKNIRKSLSFISLSLEDYYIISDPFLSPILNLPLLNMSNFNQNQAQAMDAQGGQGGAFMAPPPPAGYPTRDVQGDSSVPVTTQSKGDGFWKGCCAALCCCCVLDACF